MAHGFQTAVYDKQAPALAGDFASMNPYWSYPAGPGGLIAGPDGAVAGLAAWIAAPADDDGSPANVNNHGQGAPVGIVPRDQQGLNTVFLSGASMAIPAGFQMTVISGGDIWVVNDGATQALPGMTAYADFSTGKFNFGSAVTAGATSTGSDIAAGASSFTGSIVDDRLTVTVVGSGTIYPGTVISGANVASGTKVGAQISGTPGGVGVYAVDIPGQTVASTTITGAYGILTIGTATGTFAVGDLLAATGSVVAGTYITANLTGAGGSGGTMVVNNATVVTTQAINVASVNVATKWKAMSAGAAGELIKVSDHP